MWTLITISFSLYRYFRALKLHGTPCMTIICICTDHLWTDKHVLINITNNSISSIYTAARYGSLRHNKTKTHSFYGPWSMATWMRNVHDSHTHNSRIPVLTYTYPQLPSYVSLQAALVSEARLHRHQWKTYQHLQGRLVAAWSAYVLFNMRRDSWQCRHCSASARGYMLWRT